MLWADTWVLLHKIGDGKTGSSCITYISTIPKGGGHDGLLVALFFPERLD